MRSRTSGLTATTFGDLATDGLRVLRRERAARAKAAARAAASEAARKNRQHILPEAGDLRLHLHLGPVADADRGDDRRDTDDDAQHGEQRAHLVPAQGAQRNPEGGEYSHALSCTAFGLPQAFQFRLGMQAVRHRLVADDLAVAHDDVALGVARDVQFVRDHDDRDALVVEFLEHAHDLDAGLAVEIAGGFVREQQRRAG